MIAIILVIALMIVNAYVIHRIEKKQKLESMHINMLDNEIHEINKSVINIFKHLKEKKIEENLKKTKILNDEFKQSYEMLCVSAIEGRAMPDKNKVISLAIETNKELFRLYEEIIGMGVDSEVYVFDENDNKIKIKMSEFCTKHKDKEIDTLVGKIENLYNGVFLEEFHQNIANEKKRESFENSFYGELILKAGEFYDCSKANLVLGNKTLN